MHFAFLTPLPDPAGGGRQFNAGLVPALRALGHTVDVLHDAEALRPGAIPVVDGWLLPAVENRLDRLVAAGAVAVVHHVAARAGRDEGSREAVQAAERRMLPQLRRVITTSQPVADRLTAEFGLVEPPVVRPGQPDWPRSPGSGQPGSGQPGTHILSAGVLTRRKGHDRLLQGLARLIDLDWTLTIAGDATRDPVQANAIGALIDDLRLGGRVRLLADPDEGAMAAAWASADLFALASSWEGYPAGVAEALRRGVPIVATTVGEIPSLVPMAAGILCGPDDAITFSKCLRRAIFDRALRASLADGAWQAGQALPGWPQQALAFLSLFEG